MSPISRVRNRLFRVPLDIVLTDATHRNHTHFELITSTITLADGSEGTGYTTPEGEAVMGSKRCSIRTLAFLLGKDGDDVESINIYAKAIYTTWTGRSLLCHFRDRHRPLGYSLPKKGEPLAVAEEQLPLSGLCGRIDLLFSWISSGKAWRATWKRIRCCKDQGGRESLEGCGTGRRFARWSVPIIHGGRQLCDESGKGHRSGQSI